MSVPSDDIRETADHLHWHWHRISAIRLRSSSRTKPSDTEFTFQDRTCEVATLRRMLSRRDGVRLVSVGETMLALYLNCLVADWIGTVTRRFVSSLRRD